MLSIILTSIFFALYFPNTSVQADKSYPHFYNIDYSNSDFPNLKGIYRKEDYTHNEKSVYKKPRIDNFLYVNDDDKWTVGTKWTRETHEDRITMEDGGKDSPTSGEWDGLNSGKGDEIDIEVSVTEYKLEYPEYYQVQSSSNTLEGYYKKLPRSQNYLKFPVFEKKAHGNGNEKLFLYLNLEGDWRIDRAANNESGEGFASSYGKGSPDPYLSSGWKAWIGGSWKTDDKFKASPLNPFYPSVYTIEYHGSDETVLAELQTLNVLGNYTDRQADHYGIPQYENRQTSKNLFRCTNGRWVIAYHVSTKCDSAIYQESNGSPTPLEKLTWKITKKDHLILDLYLTVSKLPRNPRMSDDAEDVVKIGQTDEMDETNVGLVVGIVLGVVTLLIAVAITAFFIRKKFNKEEEEPRIDDNMYYGDDYYDDDNDNAVVDKNDYYEI